MLNTLSKTLMAAWITYGLPMIEVTPTTPPGFSKFTTALGWIMFIAGCLAIAAVIGIGVAIIYNAIQGNNLLDTVQWLTGAIVGMVVIGSAASIVGAFIVF